MDARDIINTIKPYAALVGEDSDNYKDVAHVKRVFDKGSDLFKLNLYPLSFQNEDDNRWEAWHYEKDGLSDEAALPRVAPDPTICEVHGVDVTLRAQAHHRHRTVA